MRRWIRKGLAVLLTAAMAAGTMPGVSTTKVSASENVSVADVWDGTTATSFAGGTGTEGDPYLIATGAQLAYLAKVINATAYADNEYARAYFKLTANIDLNNRAFEPIGNNTSYKRYFNGCFDGNNKTISNYSGSYGLFYDVGGGVIIKDLTLSNVNISGSSNIGGLVYMVCANKGTSARISNCHISGTITSTNAAIGLVYRAESPLTIENCSNSADITGQIYIAGILGGNNTSSTSDDYSVIIRNCSNSGKIVNTSTSSRGNTAGIAAYLQSGRTLIENCVNRGEIVAQSYGDKYAGIVSSSGSKEGNTIRNCENYGNVTCDVAKTSIYTAGICAYAYYTEIYDCSNVGTIHNDESALYCGGIVAKRGSDVKSCGSVHNCFNAGTIEPSYGGQIIGSEDALSNVYDNYYVNGSLAANSVNNQNNYRVSQEQAESGYLAYVLNGLTSGNVWKQKIGTDTYPKINGSEDIVYANGYCSAKATEYSNLSLSVEADKNHDLILVSAKDADCGHNGYREHYECKSCHAFFENNTDNIPVSKSNFITGTATGNHQSYDANGLCAVCGNAYQSAEKDTNGVYVIDNTGKFIWYANKINNYNYSSIPVGDAEIQLDGFDAKLDSDIDLSLVYNAESGKSWEPIAYDYSNYLNELDGQGHTIKGLYINSASLKSAGLVKKMSYQKSYIHDIVFTDVYINAPRADYVGTVTGIMESLKTAPCIENCIVKNGTINGNTYVGGLTGYVYANNADKFQQENKNIINNCANLAAVTSSSYAGGLVGAAADNGKNINIANSYNTGTISGAEGKTGDIAGTLGVNTSTVNCYYAGDKAFGNNNVSVGADKKSSDQFGSGEVAYLLQSGQPEVDGATKPVWGQKLSEEGKQAYPVIGGDEVYRNETYSGCQAASPGVISGVDYSNSQNEPVYADHTDASPSDGKCDYCGKYMDNVGARLIGHSITLDGSVGVNFYMELSEEVSKDQNAYMRFTIPGKDQADASIVDIKVSDAELKTISGKTYYMFRCDVNAAQMTDEIKAQIITSTGKGTIYTYTVKEYADYIIDNQSNPEYAGACSIVKAMLDYGSYAQKYVGYHTDRLAVGQESNLSDVSNVSIGSEYVYNSANDSNANVAFLGASMILMSRTTLRMYFRINDSVADAVTFSSGGTTINKEKEGDYYYIDIDNISADKLKDNITVTVNDGSSDLTINYSPMTYCYNVLTRENRPDNLKNLVRALVKFGQAAETYITQSSAN